MKILIVQTAFIGDVILTLPLVDALKKNINPPQIDFLTIPSSKNIVETHPDIHKLWIYDKRGKDRGPLNLWRLAAALRAGQYNCAIVPHRSLRSAALVYLAGIPKRIGFDRSSGKFLFNRLEKYRADFHEVDRNLELLNIFAIDRQIKYPPRLHISADDAENVRQWFQKHRLSHDSKIIALAPGSVWHTKRWPLSHWIKLSGELGNLGYRVIFLGSENDNSEFGGQIPENDGVLNAMGQFTLRESAEIIRRSLLLVSNDSSPTHLAAAVDGRVLTIFGATSPEFGFYPYRRPKDIIQIENLDCKPCAIHGGHKCPRGHFKCMLELKPPMVLKKIVGMLDDSSH